jgi:hypothetical protein
MPSVLVVFIGFLLNHQKYGYLHQCMYQDESLLWYSTLMMEAVCTSETLVYSSETKQCYITEGSHYHTRCHENLKCHTVYSYVSFDCIPCFVILYIWNLSDVFICVPLLVVTLTFGISTLAYCILLVLDIVMTKAMNREEDIQWGLYDRLKIEILLMISA